jgi:hypothetical protein
VLLIVLWVRSYRVHEGFYRVNSANNLTGFGWNGGALGCNYVNIAPTGTPPKWNYFAAPPVAPYQGFRGSFSKGEFFVVVPFWFLVLLTVITATVSNLPLSKRFSLRALLIATTLVAVVLGLVVSGFRK